MQNHDRMITGELLAAFSRHLREEERRSGTIEKYLRDLRSFAAWAAGQPITRELAPRWKDHLLTEGYAPVTINSMLASVNTFCRFVGWDIKLKYLKIQRTLFRDCDRELTRREYDQLLDQARREHRDRLALLMETICASGIRVSEVGYITVEAARQGRVHILLKGKVRTILLTGKLCRKLLGYARKNKIASGEIFLTGSGRRLSRRQIWAEMKALSRRAGVAPSKVFPHNLRHLFATAFYGVCKDIARLADVLGHSSIETTRLYLVTTGREHEQQMELLGLVR